MPYRTSAGDTPPSGLVVVGQYLDTVSAHMAKARLDAEGVRAFVAEAMSTNPLWNFAAGGTTLSVDAGNEEAARAILEEMRREEADDEKDDGEAEVRCPRCELEYCFLVRGVSGKRWRCRKCDHVWDDADEGPRRRTPLATGVSPPVFRLRRGHPGMGLFLGFVAGAAIAMLAGGGAASLLVVLCSVVGFFLGSNYSTDVCSEPTCRTTLAGNATRCPACRGKIEGVIQRATEHYSASASFRRERAESPPRAPRKKKKKKPASSPDA